MKYILAILIAGLALSVIPRAEADTGLLTIASDREVIVGVKYTSSYLMEFLWGLSRPFHLWNTQPDKTQRFLPFWTRPFSDGGILSWINPESWKENPNLTVGAFAADVAIGIMVTSF